MFAGDRLRSRHPNPNGDFTISMWIWNGMPIDGREVTGWFLSHGNDHGLSPNSLSVGLGGTSGNAGKLIVAVGDQTVTFGSNEIPRWTWQHVGVIRKGDQLTAFVNGQKECDRSAPQLNHETLFIGGRCDGSANWEGRIDEVAMWDRALSSKEIRQLTLPDLAVE